MSSIDNMTPSEMTKVALSAVAAMVKQMYDCYIESGFSPESAFKLANSFSTLMIDRLILDPPTKKDNKK